MSRNPVEGKVDEYVVLYTPQVRQKQKKWHDGTAKFHHFNNLLVLYDDANHKIDSTFLGRGRVLETGEELQIDNHLVSLEDLTKTTTRDISGIYTRESNTGMGSNNPPTPRVLHQTSLPQVPETTKALSNVSKRLKLSLATPVRTSTKTGTLGPTRLVLEQVSETPFKPPKAPGSTSTPAELRTSVTHLRNQLSNSPSTPTRCYNFEGEGEVVETTPRRSPATSPVQSRARTPSTVPKIISAAPNPLAPFRKPSSARDTILNTEPAPPIESVTVRARRAGIAPPPANNDQLTVREALAFSAIDTRRRSPSPDFDLDDLHDYPGLENDFPGLENDFPEYDFPGVDFPEPENDYPGVDQDIGSVKAEPLSPTFQVKEEPLSPVFGAQTRAFDADIDILSQMQVTIDDSDGDEGMDSFARTTEVIDLISDDEDEEDGVQAGLMSPFKATGERIQSPVLSPLKSPAISPVSPARSSPFPSLQESPNDTTQVDIESDKLLDTKIHDISDISDLSDLESDLAKDKPAGQPAQLTEASIDLSDLSDTEDLGKKSPNTSVATANEAKTTSDSTKSQEAPQPASKSSSFLDKPFTVPFAKPGLESSTVTASRKASRTPSSTTAPSAKFTISENGPWTKETLELFAWRG